jgi:hypothetical protein
LEEQNTHPQTEDSTFYNLLYRWNILLQGPGSKNNAPETCFADGSETPSNPTFNVCQFKFSNRRMGLMELGNCGTHGISRTFEMLKLDNVLDGVTDKMNNIWEVEHGWNFINDKFTMESGIAGTIAHNGTYPRPTN